MSNNYTWEPPRDRDLNEDDAMDIAEHLIRMKAHKHIFNGYSYDDIAQEIRLSCIKSLPDFDPKRTKGHPMKFFNMVTENHLRNLKRDKLYAFRPPCENCEFRNGKDKCKKYRKKESCKPYVNYLKAFDVKVNLNNPLPIYKSSNDDGDLEFYYDESHAEDSQLVDTSIAEEEVLRLLTTSQQRWLKIWLDNSIKKTIPLSMKKRIIKILKEFYKPLVDVLAKEKKERDAKDKRKKQKKLREERSKVKKHKNNKS